MLDTINPSNYSFKLIVGQGIPSGIINYWLRRYYVLYSAIFDLFQETQASFDYLAKIVKSGFVYDLKYDLVYPTVSQLFQTTLIPQFIQNIDPQVIADLVAINSNIYKKNTYINTNL